MSSQTLCFVGGGNMARSLIGGLIDNGMKPQFITVGEPDAGRREELTNDFGVTGLADNIAATKKSDIVILAVKPQVMKTAVLPLVGELSGNKPLLISIAAGISISNIESWVGDDLAIVRAMPNTPALINAGITALFANSRVLPEQRDHAETILRAVGKVLWFEDETLMDAVTAVSGSGPAYFFYFMEALWKQREAKKQCSYSGSLTIFSTQTTVVEESGLTSRKAYFIAKNVCLPPISSHHQCVLICSGCSQDRTLRVKEPTPASSC